MCGLVFQKSFERKPVIEEVFKRFEKQRARGTQGFGVFLPELSSIYRTETEDKIKTILETHKNCHEALFHHRMPTSTINVQSAAHPFTTGRMFKHNYVLAHNGIIHNEKVLQAEHERHHKIKYQSMQEDGTFNDSESLLWEMAMYLEGLSKEPATKGGAAFIILENVITKFGVKPIKVHFGRNDANPLYMGLDEKGLTLASEKDTWDVDAHSIMPDFLYTYNYHAKTLTVKPMKLARYYYTQHGGMGYRTPATKGYDRDYEGYGANSEYWDQFNKHTKALPAKSKATGTIEAQEPKFEKLLIGDVLDRKADSFLADMLDKYEDMDELEARLNSDIKRARQATTQLSEIVHQGGAKRKVIKKYYKYMQYLQIALRATSMLALLDFDQTNAAETVKEPISE